MRKGFTLVELSIVLVIIGLLIGGILVAQSMVSTSKTVAQIRQIGEFDAAVANFITKYNSIPGESRAMGCINQPGTTSCENGIIDDWYTVTSTYNTAFRIWAFYADVANFWTQLGRSGFAPQGVSYSNAISGTFKITGTSPNSPAAVIDPKNVGIMAGSTRMQPGWPSNTVYQFADYSSYTDIGALNIQSLSAPAMSSAEAAAIDKKMDDGTPSGSIITSKIFPTTTPSAYYANPDSTACVSGGKYTGSSTKACGLAVQIMSGSGGIPIRSTDN